MVRRLQTKTTEFGVFCTRKMCAVSYHKRRASIKDETINEYIRLNIMVPRNAREVDEGNVVEKHENKRHVFKISNPILF